MARKGPFYIQIPCPAGHLLRGLIVVMVWRVKHSRDALATVFKHDRHDEAKRYRYIKSSRQHRERGDAKP